MIDEQNFQFNLPIAIIPKLHMSTFFPYCFRVTTSGALQHKPNVSKFDHKTVSNTYIQ